MSSHTELRCPECRVLVDIKIDELPPNVLLMRILEGMKNATTALNNGQTKNAIAETVALSNHSQSQTSLASELPHTNGGANNDHGMSNQTSARDHIKRTVPLNSEPIHRAMVKSNAPTTTHNSNSVQNIGTSLSIPHAKALYDFESKEPG